MPTIKLETDVDGFFPTTDMPNVTLLPFKPKKKAI